MNTKHFPKGLDNRMRDANGQIRQKNGNTKVSTLRVEYGNDFANDYRADTKLKTVLKKSGMNSLTQYLKHSGTYK